jgi:YVTN family beta-propeller protein
MPNISKKLLARAGALFLCAWMAFVAISAASPALADDAGGPGASVVNNILIPSVPPGGNPIVGDTQVNAKTNRVYVTSETAVTVMDGATNNIITTIQVPQASVPNINGETGLYQSCVDDVSNTIYSLAENGVVTAINGANNTIIGTFAPLPVSTIANVDGIACNPDTGKLYMVLWNPGSNVVVWDTKQQKTVAVLTVTNHEEWLAVNRKTNRIYAQTDFQGVVVIDGRTDTVLTTINAGQIPQPVGCTVQVNCVNNGSWLEKIAVNEETNRVYVVGINDGSLTTIDGSNNTVIRTDYYDYDVYSVAVDPIRNLVYLVDISLNVLTVVDGASGTRKGNLGLGPGPFPIGCASNNGPYPGNVLNINVACVTANPQAPNLATGADVAISVNPATGKIYAGYTGVIVYGPPAPAPYANTMSFVTVLAPAANAPAPAVTASTPKEIFAGTVTLAVKAGAVDAAVNTRTNTLYIANSGSNNVSAINLSTQSIGAPIPVGASPRALTANESTNTLYTFNGDGSISVLDAGSGVLLANFSVDTNASGLLGLSPQAVAFSRRTGKLYAINAFNQIDVINPTTRQVSAIIDPDASSVAINQSTNTIYVSHYSEGSVSIIDGWSDRAVGVISGVGLPAQPSGCYHGAGGPNACLQMSSGLIKIVVDESLNRIYALGQFDGLIATIDGQTNKVVGRQYINPGDYGLTVDPNTHTVFADSVTAPALWVIDGRTGGIGGVVNFNSLFCNTAGNSCYNHTDLKSVTVNPATGGVYVLDQGDLNPQKTSMLYIVNPSPGP